MYSDEIMVGDFVVRPAVGESVAVFREAMVVVGLTIDEIVLSNLRPGKGTVKEFNAKETLSLYR